MCRRIGKEQTTRNLAMSEKMLHVNIAVFALVI